jgi:IS30 family transposase
MAKTYHQLTQELRDRIAALSAAGHSQRQIATVLGIAHTTVGRELRRNSYGTDARTPGQKKSIYDATAAQQKAYVRRKYAKYQGKKIQEDNELRSFIILKLSEHWNPNEIAGYLKENPNLGMYASKTAIYEWLHSAWGQQYCTLLYCRRYNRKPRRKNKTDRVMIPDRTSITERPVAALDRAEAGHCEYDSVVSSKRSGSTYALAVVQERSTRLVRAQLVPNLKPAPYAAAILALTKDIATRTMTTDNGIENRSHQDITQKTGAPVFFTDPYSSWQKGGVENANKMLRRYFPKGTDFSTVRQTDVVDALTRINNKPRKILGYKSSLQVAKEKGVLRE